MGVFPDSLPVLYINRDEDVDRRAYMEAQFEAVGIRNAIRFPAFTGDLKSADPGFREELLNIKDIHPNRVNVYRAVASHLWAIQSIDFKDSPYALVFEDDVVLTTCLNWGFSFKDFCDALPEGWDVIQLYLNPRMKELPVSLRLRPYRAKYMSTLAYLITKERAEQICKDWFRAGVPDISKLHSSFGSSLTDEVVYTYSSYGVNLFSTTEFVSTIIDKIPDRFHKNSREVIRLWEEEPLSLEELVGASYTETLP
jgi:hypothetical protein